MQYSWLGTTRQYQITIRNRSLGNSEYLLNIFFFFLLLLPRKQIPSEDIFSVKHPLFLHTLLLQGSADCDREDYSYPSDPCWVKNLNSPVLQDTAGTFTVDWNRLEILFSKCSQTALFA